MKNICVSHNDAKIAVKGSLKARVPNPHGLTDISDSLLNEILRQAGITKKEWREIGWR